MEQPLSRSCQPLWCGRSRTARPAPALVALSWGVEGSRRSCQCAWSCSDKREAQRGGGGECKRRVAGDRGAARDPVHPAHTPQQLLRRGRQHWGCSRSERGCAPGRLPTESRVAEASLFAAGSSKFSSSPPHRSSGGIVSHRPEPEKREVEPRARRLQ
jgi:hypothetical protein